MARIPAPASFRRWLSVNVRRIAASTRPRAQGRISRLTLLPDDISILGDVDFHEPASVDVVIKVNGHVYGHGRIEPSDRETRRSWSASVDRHELAPGALDLEAVAILPEGQWQVIDQRSIHIDTSLSLGGLDEPEADDVIETPVVIARGWFRATQGYDRVVLRANGRPVGDARLLSYLRLDVADLIDDVDAPLAGWEATFEVPDDGSTVLELIAEATGPDGTVRIGERRWDIELAIPEPEDIDRLRQLAERTAVDLRRRLDRRSSPCVIVATHHLGLGGGQLYLHELLSRLRHDFEIVVLSSIDGALREELEEWGIPVEVVGIAPTDGLDYESWMRQVAGLMPPGAAALVANTAGSYWGVDLAERSEIPALWAIHESFTPNVFLRIGMNGTADTHVRARFRAAFGYAERTIFEADATRELFSDLMPEGAGIRVDYGVDLEKIADRQASEDRDAVRRDLKFEPSDIVLLCMGTFESRKAQALLATAFAGVVDKHPNAVLALVGDRPNQYSDGVHRVLSRLDLADRVRVVPVTPAIDDWYAASDAFVLASDVESLPRSMLEAMAFGIPIIGPRVFGVPELIKEDVEGILFRPSSVADVRDAIDHFLSMSVEQRRQMGEAGRQVVLSSRSAAGYASTYRDLLAGMIARRRDQRPAQRVAGG